jgi:DNA end-binding protein Ku
MFHHQEENMSASPFANVTPDTSAPGSPSLPGSAATRGRASWSGLLKLSLVTIPVKAYPAASTSQQIHFNQLHAGCGQRIRYEKHCPVHGQVDAGAIVSGYAYAPDQYVVVDQAELEPLRPAQERALCLERFLEPHALDPALFSGRTLYLLPDGMAAHHAYAVLTQMLGQRRKWALGRVVLGGHRVLALVRPCAQLLALHVLHFPEQLRSAAALPTLPRLEAASPEEQQLAGLLIDAACQPIAWSEYQDDAAEKLRTFIQAKLAGRTLTAPVPEEIPILQLVDALKRSVAQTLEQQDGAKHDPVAEGEPTVNAGPRLAKRKSSRKVANRRSA